MESRRYVKSTRYLRLFLPPLSIRRDQGRRYFNGKLNQDFICISTLTCRRLYFLPVAAFFLIWHDVFIEQLSPSILHQTCCKISMDSFAEMNSRSKSNIQLIWIYDFRRYECAGKIGNARETIRARRLYFLGEINRPASGYYCHTMYIILLDPL